jgi:hypothetical protein
MHTQKTAHPTRPRRTGRASSVWIALGLTALTGAAVFVLPNEWRVSSSVAEATTPETVIEKEIPKLPSVEHVATPASVKGIYMSQCVVGTPSFREKLVAFIDETQLNSVVIDIKDYTGKIAFTTDNPMLKDSVSDQCGARDMRSFIKLLHEKGIYVIGRITVFQDPYYTSLHPEQSVQSKSRPGEPWEDHKGLSFIAPTAKSYWEYVVALSHEAHDVFGFDELNYDYIRWPSDGPMEDVVYPAGNRSAAVETFWQYLAGEMESSGAVLSADLFGMTTTNTDDLNIGQQLERALPHFDYIMPMVYPSHYPKGFNGLSNPNLYPYDVVNFSMASAARRAQSPTTPVQTLAGKPVMKTEVVPATATSATTTREVPSGLYTKEVYKPTALRTWLQDFDYGKDYTKEDIVAQIQATYDAGLTSWIFWDPANRYESLHQALRENPSL